VLFILSTLAFIAYTLLLKRFRLPYPSLTIPFWLFVFAALNFFLFLPLDRVPYSSLFSFDLKGLIGVLFGGIFTSTIAYCCFNYAVAKIDTNEVGVFLYIDPLIAALIAVPLLGEQITLTYLVGSVLVFLGIFIAEKRLQYHPLHKLRRS
jgi:drug/metabolite transporter (DMT)-like permease